MRKCLVGANPCKGRQLTAGKPAVQHLSVDIRYQKSCHLWQAKTEVTMTKKPKAKPVAQKLYQVEKRNLVAALLHAVVFAASVWIHPVVTTDSVDRSLA